MRMRQRAPSAWVWCSLFVIATACSSKPAVQASDPAAWGSGIVVHKAPLPSIVEGPRVATTQSMAAGQWDSPKQMYVATCGGCHGVGVGPPILGQALPEPYIRYIARNGRRAMPPFRPTDYSDADLATLATWIDAQPAAGGAPAAGGPAAPGAAAPATAPAPARRGAGPEATFASCSGCHDNGAPPLRGQALLEGYVDVVVRHGLRRMPAFPETSISDAELAALVTWLNAQPRRRP
jgi:mono/diheme cytochrome c family protein